MYLPSDPVLLLELGNKYKMFIGSIFCNSSGDISNKTLNK